MRVRNLLNDLNISTYDCLCLLVLMVFASVFTFKAISNNMTIHIRSDSLIYLTNSLFYAGANEDLHNTWTMFLSPVICFLTGMLMRLGLGSESIFIVTGIFDVFAYLSMYCLMKYRFNRVLSLFGSLLFGSFIIVLKNWADGTIDVPVVSVSIWVIIFLILAVHENPKYYLITFPLLVVAIFTKYSAFFMVPLVLLYFLSKNDFFSAADEFLHDRNTFKKRAKSYMKSDEFRYIVLGLVIAAALFVLFCAVITSFGSGLLFTTQISDSFGGFEQHTYATDKFYNDAPQFYVSNIASIFAVYGLDFGGYNISTLFLVLIVISCSIHLITYYINTDSIRELQKNARPFKTHNFSLYLKVLFVILAVVFFYGYFENHMLANVAMLSMMVVAFSFLDRLEINRKFYSMNFLMIAWFLIYLIFYSKINIKMERYLISCLPAVIYFVLWSLESIFSTVQNGLDYGDSFVKKYVENPTFKFSYSMGGTVMLCLIIVAIGLVMAATFSYETPETFKHHTPDELDEFCEFLVDYDPDYASKSISSYNSYCSRYCQWYLHKDVILNKSMKTPTTDYVITIYPEDYPMYDLVHRTKTMYLYERID